MSSAARTPDAPAPHQLIAHLLAAMREFCRPKHLTFPIMEDSHACRFRAWINFEAQRCHYGLRLRLAQDYGERKATQDRRPARFQQDTGTSWRAGHQGLPVGINNEDA
jgi:hypothetical protein